MRRVRTVIAAAAVSLVVPCANAVAIPLHPRTVERLTDYGRLHEWVWIAENSTAEGIRVQPSEDPVLSLERPAAGLRVLALLVEFEDVPGVERRGPREVARLLFGEADRLAKSVAGFFSTSSGGALTVSGEVFGWVPVPGLLGEYASEQAGLGRYPTNAQKLVEDALAAAGDLPLKEFDEFGRGSGGDGVVDVLLVVHSGRGAEITGEPGDLWSHTGMLPSPIKKDGMRVESYILAAAESGRGLLCHEIALLLGAPPLYDPTYRGTGLDAWSLMGTGAWSGNARPGTAGLDAYSRVHLGFATPVDVREDRAGVVLGCGRQPPTVFRLFPQGRPGPEYFLVECRSRFRFDRFLPGEGVLIYHVDERSADGRFPGCGPGLLHPRVAVEQADGRCELEAGLRAEANDLWARLDVDRFPPSAFDDSSTPNSNDYKDHRTGVAVRNLRLLDGDLVADFFVTAEPDSSGVLRLTANVEKEKGRSVVIIRVRGVRRGPVELRVRNPEGRVVWSRDLSFKFPGNQQVRWDPSAAADAASGVYFVEAETADGWDVRRVSVP